MNKRNERVKSIFDSDDSDEENITSLRMPYHKNEEEDEDSKLRKTIEEVCSSLGNENEGSSGLEIKLSAEEPNELLNENDMKKTTQSSSDSEGEDKNLKKQDKPRSSTSKFVIPIIEENEYNLLSKICIETVETSLEEETDVKASQDDDRKGNILEEVARPSSDIGETYEAATPIPTPDSKELKEACLKENDENDIRVDIKLGMETSDIKELSEEKDLDESNPENSEEKMIDTCEGSEETNCFDSLNDEGMVARSSINSLPILNTGLENNCENTLENNIESGYDQEKISSTTNNMFQCDLAIKDHEEINKQENSITSRPSIGLIDDFEMKSDKPNSDLSNDSSNSNQEYKQEENLKVRLRPSPLDDHMIEGSLINKEEENLELTPASRPSSILDGGEIMDVPLINKGIIPQSICDEPNSCESLTLPVDSTADSNINSALETMDKEDSELIGIPGDNVTSVANVLKSNIDSIIDNHIPSSIEKVTVKNSQDEEIKNNFNCVAEGEKKRKVRVEDVFTDSESETASSFSPVKQPVIKIVEGDTHDSNIGPPLKKIRRKRPRATSINLPAIMLAFEKGWVREVVYRASANFPVFPKRADIYYYTPEGKKLRSRIEIEDFLKKNNIVDLSLQNFSFFKEPLGVEECYEKIRHASASKIPMTPTFNEGNQSINVGPKKRIRKSAKIKDGVLPAKIMRIEMLNKNSKEKDMGSRNIALKESQRYYVPGNFPNVLNSYSPVFATHLFPCNPPLSYPRIITSLIKGASKDKAFHCTPNCFAGGGNIPNLQCVKCICLFHPDCCHVPLAAIPLILSSQAKFLCPNCYKEEAENFEEKEFTPAPCFEPLAYDPSSDSEDEGLCSDFEHPSYTRLYSRPASPQITTSLLRQLSNLQSPNIAMLSPTTVLPDSGICLGNTSLVQNSLLNNGVGASLPQYMPPYLQNANAISVSFPTTSVKSGPAISLALPSTYFHSTPSTPNSFPPSSPGIPFVEDTVGIPSQSAQKKSCHSKSSKQSTSLLRGGVHFMEDLYKCYSVLRHIFSFLSVPDLLVVSRVCHMWRDLALGSTFWTSVRLRNVCVKDWGKMVKFLERRGTSSLDLRKMVLCCGMASQSAEKVLEKKFVQRFSDTNISKDFDAENIKDHQEINEDNEKDAEKEAMDEFNNTCVRESKESKHAQLDTFEDSETSNNGQIISSAQENEEESVLVVKDCASADKANEVEMSDETRDETSELSKKESEVELSKKESEVEFKEENMEIEFKEENMEFDASEQHNDCDSILEVNNILVKEIDALSKNKTSFPSENEENNPQCYGDSQNSKNMENKRDSGEHSADLKKEAEEQKLKEIQKDKIVTSVLNEHDYFGTQSKAVETEDSDNNSSDSDDSDSQLDQNEIEADRALDEKLEFHKKNVEDGNLKEMLQWEHEPQIHPEWRITGATQTEIGEEEEVELVCKLKENLKQKSKLDTPLYKEWDAISIALSKLQCLRSIVLGPCESIIVELFLSHCNQLTGITALNLSNFDNEDVISFDPSFLMQTKQLKELRLGSKKNFHFKSNFNFIKLPDLKVLMLKGLKTAETGWPYMGIHLTHLHLSCINTFSHKNWLNISSMTGLLELELDGNGSDFDSEICVALTKLVNLKRLALLDWNIGPKLPFTLRKLHNIKYLHVIPAVEASGLQGIYAGRLMVMLDFTKHLEEFVWGIQPKNRMMDEKTGEKIYIQTMKPGKETGVMEGEKVRAIAIDSFKGFIKCRIPQTKVTVRKVASSNWITGDSWF